jgi:hypothetical protein
VIGDFSGYKESNQSKIFSPFHCRFTVFKFNTFVIYLMQPITHIRDKSKFIPWPN